MAEPELTMATRSLVALALALLAAAFAAAPAPAEADYGAWSERAERTRAGEEGEAAAAPSDRPRAARSRRGRDERARAGKRGKRKCKARGKGKRADRRRGARRKCKRARGKRGKQACRKGKAGAKQRGRARCKRGTGKRGGKRCGKANRPRGKRGKRARCKRGTADSSPGRGPGGGVHRDEPPRNEPPGDEPPAEPTPGEDAPGPDDGDGKRPDEMAFGFAGSGAIYGEDRAPRPDELARLEAAAGADLARISVHWEEVQRPEPRPGVPADYDWSRFAPYVDALEERGVRPVLVLLGAPGWARQPDPTCWGGSLCPPEREHLDDWQRFVRAAARRFPGAAAIEVWNEPNYRYAWKTSGGPDPERYAELFETAVRAVRSVDAKMTVVLGGLGYQPPIPIRWNTPIPEFLDGFYRAVDDSALDRNVAIGVHPYPGDLDLLGFLSDGNIERVLGEARKAIAAADPRPHQRKLWVTEVGVTTTGLLPLTAPPERQQANTLVNIVDWLGKAPDVAATIVYTIADRPPDPSRPLEAGFGVVGRGPDFEPKPAYCKLAAAQGMPAPRGC